MSTIKSWQMTAKDQPFELVEKPIPNLNDGEALVKIAGCGVCHTDISFWHYGVPTKHELPLVLGHEISGIVEDGPVHLIGKAVIIPAVMPCGDCDLCNTGRGNICQKQQMPGNDFHGGFSTHIVTPSQYLAVVPDSALKNHSLAELAVIADAISTPYQVMVKSGVKNDDFAIIIGVGGVGIYAAQIAKILGAKVLALDISQDKLDQLKQVGINDCINTYDMGIKEIKGVVKEKCKEMGAPKNRWKIYEMSGSKPGQELAFALMGIASTLSIVGFTMDKLDIRLSNLMAFDANIIGTWGCKPELYVEVLQLVADEKLHIKPFTELFQMDEINNIFQQTLEHKLTKRSVLIP